MNEQARETSSWLDLRRHPVVQAAAVYVGASWALIEGADIFFPSFGLSLDAIRWLGLVLALGFVATLGFVWWSTSRRARPARADGDGEPPRAAARSRGWVYVTVVATLLLGGLFWWLRPRLLGQVSPAAEVIAVMPFHTSGRDVELLGEGMVDLLTPNLDAVGGIRTVDARTVLHNWRQRARDGSLDLAGALDVGREVEAGSILWGSATAAGPEVRLTAELYTVKGNKLASARADGPADSVLQLVDSLTVNLLHDIWVAREPVPNLRVSAITTGSVDAIRAYLLGEQYYRRSRWDSAVHAFQQALESDSTFALAHYRLALTHGWATGHGSRPARRHGEAARRFSQRLPPREQTMVIAHQLFEEGDMAAHDTMLRYTSTYPDDAEGWYLLGDVRNHAAPLLAPGVDELFAPFRRVLDLDPSLAPAFIHPVELSLQFRDSARYARWSEALRQAAPEQARPYVLAGKAAWGPLDRRAAFMDSISDHSITGYVAVGMFETETRWDSVVAYLRGLAETAPGGSPVHLQALANLAVVNTALGRLEEARPIFARLWDLSPNQVGQAGLMPFLAGLADSSFAPGPLAALREAPPGSPLQRISDVIGAIRGLSSGDPNEARRLLESMDASDLPPPLASINQALSGWATVLEGDTVAGMARMEEGLLEAGYGGQAIYAGTIPRLQLAMLELARPETRERGINRLRYGSHPAGFTHLALRFLLLGQALEEAGDTAGAARAYSLFIHHWEKADPHLQPRVETARRALARLTGERSE